MWLDVKLINSFNRYIERSTTNMYVLDSVFKLVSILWETGKRLYGWYDDPNERKVNRYFVNMGLTGNIDNNIINVFNTNERSTERNEFTIVAVIEN